MPESGFGDGKAEPGHSLLPERSNPHLSPRTARSADPGSSLSRHLRAAPAVLGPGSNPGRQCGPVIAAMSLNSKPLV